jgi:hypothetical protein
VPGKGGSCGTGGSDGALLQPAVETGQDRCGMRRAGSSLETMGGVTGRTVVGCRLPFRSSSWTSHVDLRAPHKIQIDVETVVIVPKEAQAIVYLLSSDESRLPAQ